MAELSSSPNKLPVLCFAFNWNFPLIYAIGICASGILAIYSLLATFLSSFGYYRVLAYIYPYLRYQRLDIFKMLTRCGMIIVFGHAGRKLNHDPVLFNPFLLFDLSLKARKFAMKCFSATSSACKFDFAVIFILWINRKAASSLIKCFFTKVSGTSFFDDMTLNYYDIILLFDIYHLIFLCLLK